MNSWLKRNWWYQWIQDEYETENRDKDRFESKWNYKRRLKWEWYCYFWLRLNEVENGDRHKMKGNDIVMSRDQSDFCDDHKLTFLVSIQEMIDVHVESVDLDGRVEHLSQHWIINHSIVDNRENQNENENDIEDGHKIEDQIKDRNENEWKMKIELNIMWNSKWRWNWDW